MMKLFADRVEAGRLLASALASAISKNAIVLAIPRGGVVVGFEVAHALGIPLDVIIPRKIGAPQQRLQSPVQRPRPSPLDDVSA